LILVLTFSFYPLIFFAVTAALRQHGPGVRGGGADVGAPAWRGSLGIVVPLVLPAILSSCVFVSWRPWVRSGRRRRSATAPAFHTLTTKIYELSAIRRASSSPRRRRRRSSALRCWASCCKRWALGGKRFNIIGGKLGAAARSTWAGGAAPLRLVHAGDRRERGPATLDPAAYLDALALEPGVHLAEPPRSRTMRPS